MIVGGNEADNKNEVRIMKFIEYTNEITKEFGNGSYVQMMWDERDGRCEIWVNNIHLLSIICGEYTIGNKVSEIMEKAENALTAGENLRKTLTMSVHPYFTKFAMCRNN